MASSGLTIDTSYITPSGVLAATIVPTVLSIISVILRFHVRRKQKAPILWDDWLLVPGLLCTIGMAIALIVGVAGHGMGYTKGLPAGSPPEAQLFYLAPNVVLTEQVEYAVQLLQILGLGFIKASFIMFYRRIFCAGHRNWFWYLTIVMLVLISCWTIIFFFLFVFYCGSNVWAEWSTVMDLATNCPNGPAYQQGLAISDFLMDIMVILLPVPLVMRLHIDLRRKLLVILVFMLGLVAIAASTTRMAIFIIQMTIGFDLSEDGDKVIGLILFWSIIENGAAIVAACLPTLRLLLGRNSFDGLIKSIRSKLSLTSLRTNRSHRRTSDTESQQTMTFEQMQQFDKLRGKRTVDSRIEHSEDDREKNDGEGIAIHSNISQHESWV